MLLNEKKITLRQTKLVKREFAKYHSYFIEGRGYIPSNTTILDGGMPVSFGLKHFWQNKTPEEAQKILETASAHGTNVHRHLELINQGIQLITSEHPYKEMLDVRSYLSWNRLWKPKTAYTEVIAAYLDDNYPFGTTIDWVGEINGETWLLDYKTANVHQQKHELQCIAGKKAFEQSYDKKIDRLGILRLGTQHRKEGRRKVSGLPATGLGFEFIEVHELKDGDEPIQYNSKGKVDFIRYSFDDFKLAYDMYKLVNGRKIPEPPIEESLPDTLGLFDQKDEV